MKQTKLEKRFLFWILLGTALIIMMTRIPTLANNRQLHPDEHVFYLGANSLLNAILHPGTAFEEYMEYPEGSYYFHVLFQFAGKVISKLVGAEHDLQIWGRIASVCYFVMGVFLGIRIMVRYLGKSRAAVGFYCLTMCFSLFFIEQSRYGTGDMISFMLLMLLINLTAQAMESCKPLKWWAVSFFVCGILGAVKYPLLVFMLIPTAAFLYGSPQGTRKRIPMLFGFLVVCIAGFLMFSPKAALDPAYFLRVLQREGDAYIASGTTHEAGGFLNHLAVMLLYGTVYSDFPLLLPLTIAGFFFTGRKVESSEHRTKEQWLFRVVLPGVCILFFGYNLFARLLFFRTYTPFFGIAALYTAELAAYFVHRKGAGRVAMILLSLVMILRGAALSGALSAQEAANNRVSQQIEAAVDENWTQTYVTSMFSLYEIPENSTVSTTVNLDQLIKENNGVELQPGQLVITGAYGYHLGQKYLLPAGRDSQRPVEQWESFQKENAPYLVGQAYPGWYYALFGGWLRGGTLSQYEFPVNYIYYCK